MDKDWFADSYLAIDQGPTVVITHRAGLYRRLFISNPGTALMLAGIDWQTDAQ